MITGLGLSVLCLEAQARDIDLGTRTSTICVGKSATILQSRTQVNRWVVNGRTSRLSTFSYPGRFAHLTLDTDEANVVAACRRVGNEKFSFQFTLNFSDPNTYKIDINVNCIPCPRRGLQEVRQSVKLAREALRLNRRQKAAQELQRADQQIRQQMDKLNPRTYAKLQRALELLDRLKILVLEGAGASGEALELMEILQRELNSIQENGREER